MLNSLHGYESHVLKWAISVMGTGFCFHLTEGSRLRRLWQTLSMASPSVTSCHASRSSLLLRKRDCCALRAATISLAISFFCIRRASLYRSLCIFKSLRNMMLPGCATTEPCRERLSPLMSPRTKRIISPVIDLPLPQRMSNGPGTISDPAIGAWVVSATMLQLFAESDSQLGLFPTFIRL